MSAGTMAAIAGVVLTAGGAVVGLVCYFVRAELNRFWLRLQGPEGFLPRREADLRHEEIERRLGLQEARR